MGKVSQRLQKRFKKERRRAIRQGRLRSLADFDLQEEQPLAKELIEEGYDPLHATYIQAQHVTSVFSEQLSQLPELDAFYEIIAPAEDQYMPSGPPMSPLTTSYFTSWAFFDCQFGPDLETLGDCIADLAEIFEMSPFLKDAIQAFNTSRMGIYEALANRGGRTLLRELLTGREYDCLIPAGYKPERGELLYLRRLPPIDETPVDYHVAFTTPYVLVKTSKADWTAYLRRTLQHAASANMEQAFHHLLKYGPESEEEEILKPHFWNEFIFEAYHRHQQDAVFLAGLPDVKGSRPHAFDIEKFFGLESDGPEE